MERLVSFTLFGQEFTFYSDASPEEVDKVVEMVREELQSLDGASRSTVPSSKILVLGCLQIAARYVQLEKEFEAFRRCQESSIDKLIDKVSSGMK
ncbi:cell division protein ZapA [Desulfolithobacter sp.]